MAMTTGTVKFFNESKGYGFIAPDGGGNDAFVHISAVERSGMNSLRENQRVRYDLQQDNRGKMSAVNLSPAEDPAEAPATETAAPSAEPEAAASQQPEEGASPASEA
jgi:CspA family cold shock protein